MTCPGEDYCTAHPQAAVLQEIADERTRQDAKWGIQNHPDGTGGEDSIHNNWRWTLLRDVARDVCDREEPTWLNILREEVYEAFAEADPYHLRAELVQAAAVIVAWVEAIDRRG